MSLTPRPSAAAIRRRFSAGGAVMSTLPATTGPTHELLHVAVGRVEQPAALGGRQHGDRARLPVGDQVRALQRVDRDVDLGRLADGRGRVADPLADVEHRGLVALALADHDPGVDGDLVEGPAHGLHGDPVGVHRVAAAHQARRGDRGGLGDADQLQREQPFHRSGPPLRGATPPRLSAGSGAAR